MTSKRFVVMLGAALLVALLAIGFSSRPIDSASPRQFSERALSIISAVDPAARVKVEDLNCSVKVGWGLAQCGSQASSCKNCHEVKGEDAVNAKGDWHISHAFGDFCEFCHAGNVAATDKAAAHEGMVTPLGDVKANCSSCHADDFQTRAEKYATVLGVTVGASDTKPPAASSGSDTPAAQPTAQPAQDSAPKPAIVLPPKAEIVDYNQPASSVSMGNVITALLLVATVVGGGAFVYWNEKRLRKGKLAGAVVGAAAPSAGEEAVTSIDQLPPEVVKLLPTLKQLDPRTLKALRIILSDRKRGEELLQSLSVINYSVLDEMKRLDKKELSLLLALAGEG
jgi:cytochrome c553